MRPNIYQVVTDQMLTELKAGARAWIQPWSRTPGLNLAANAITRRPYSGVNALLLWIALRKDWPQPRFLTYKQALAAGGHVCKGEHGHRIVFVKNLHVQEREKDDSHVLRMLRWYVVFNIAQCDDLTHKITAPPPSPDPDQRDALIDEFVASIGACIGENDTREEAIYALGVDQILLPSFRFFRGRAEYYAVLFHELIHWTGHKSRLDRDLAERFGERSKAAEQLIAELGAAFLCAEFSIDGYVPHAAYIESYLKLLQDDPKAIFTAASKAQAAADFLRDQILKSTSTVEAA
jgi:antirestriction protein ArdC